MGAHNSLPQSKQTIQRTEVPNTSTKVTLSEACSTIVIWLDDGSSNLHCMWNSTVGPATTSHPRVSSGKSYTYQGVPIKEFFIIGDGSDGYFNIHGY